MKVTFASSKLKWTMLNHHQIVEGFQNRTLEKSHWTHQAHQIVAIWYLITYEADDALCRLRSGIIAYNLATGTENTGSTGYHETITVFWWRLTHIYILHHSDKNFFSLCDAFIHSNYSARSTPFSFYSKERLLSSAARSRYLEPDLTEIKL